MQLYFFVYLLAANILTFLFYAMDKYKAKHHKWRIPEKTLILLAVIGGSIGALAGMYLLRHKTRHLKFVVGVPLIFVLQIAAIVYFVFIR